MQGDDLAICLFLASLAATFAVGAVSQAGWKHKAFVASLFAVAGLFLAAAVGWPWLKDVHPGAKAAASQVAANPVAWFAVIILGTAATLVHGLRRSFPGERAPETQGSNAEPQDIGRSLYVGRIVADTNKLLSDLYLEFAVVAFNGAPVKLTLEGVRGFISFGVKVPTRTSDLVRLPSPTIRDDNPLQFAPFGEFMIIVSQRLPSATAAEISRALSAGEQVEFSFEALAIELRDDADGQKMRLPLGPSWEWAILQREKDLLLLKRQIRLSVHAVIGGNAGSETR